MPDTAFRHTIQRNITDILDGRPSLRAALEASASAALGVNPGDLVTLLCEADPAVCIDDVLRPATAKCLGTLDSNSGDRKDTWEAAKSLLGWLSLFSVNPEWIERQERAGGLGDIGFEIAVSTPCGVEIVSSRYRQIPPKLRAERDKPDVFGDDRIAFPKVETGWNDDLALDRLLMEIWRRAFPEEGRQALSVGDLRTLNATLARREKNKTHHYYVPVTDGDGSPLTRPDFYQRFIEKLPAATVICLKSAGEASALQVNDEYDFMTVIREFLTTLGPEKH